MPYIFKKLEKSQIEFTFTVPPADYKQAAEAAAKRISERAAIKGFRPGKAPYGIVKEQLGEQKILEEALDGIVQSSYFTAIKKENLDAVGYPQIQVEKMAPGNDLIFKATVANLPAITLPDLSKIKVEEKNPTVEPKQAEEVIRNLQKMQRKETAKIGPADKEDKLVIDMEMFVDKIPMEGGQAKDHQVYMSEDHYVKGLTNQLIGLKKDDNKEFSLPFPADHYQKQFAGKTVDFKIKVKNVFALGYPELDDDFAKTLGQESIAKLSALVQNNLLEEAKHKEAERLEIAILEQIVEGTIFGEIPDILVKSEKEKMFYELKNSLERQGMSIEQYLKDIKKTEEQIYNDFQEQALKRAKAALVSREIAKQNNIKAETAEIEAEKKRIIAAYGDEEKIKDNLSRPEVVASIATILQNKKVIAWLKNKILNLTK